MNLSHPRAGTRRVRASFAVVAALAVAAAGALVPTGASAADTPPSDLARLGTVRASASQDDGDGAFPAELAVDGNDATRWASGNGPDSETAEFTAWLESDLGGPATIDGVTLRWETSYAVDYDVSVALDDPDDASSWTTVYSQHAGDGGVDDITFDAPARARYVRVDMNKRAAATWQAPILHWYGYSLYTLQVLGTLDTPTVGLASTAVTGSAGTDVSVPVTLSNAADHEVSVRARTADGTARAGTDYEAVDRVVTFAPGETTATVTVPTTSHGALNGTRTFTVGLSEPSSGLELRTPSEVTVTLAPTGDLPDVGRTSVLEGFESGVPTTYVPWAQNTAPGLSTAVDATRPGATEDNHVLRVATTLPNSYFGVTYENRVANVSQTFDWSAQDALSFWFLGTGSGKTFAYEIHNRNAAGTELAWAADVTDSSAGWRKVTTRFADFKAKSGVPAGQAFDPTVSTGFAVTLTGLGAGTFSFDDFALVERASLLDDFEHGITGDAATATGYFAWSSPAATVTLGERTVERDGDAANTTLGGTYQVPAGGWGGVSDNLLATQDWSSYRGVRFWWYASQADNPASPTAGNDVTFELKDGGPDAEHAESWTATFRDSWSTAGSRWKLVELPFSAFTLGANQPGSAETKNGVLDLTSTWGWSLTFPTGTAETAYALDDVQLYGTPRAAARVTVSTTQDVYLVDAGGTATVEVAVSAPGGAALENPVSVAYSLDGGTAVAGTDFTAASGTLTFPAGTASGSTRTFDVVTAPDRPADTARTLSVRLAGSGLTLPTAAPRVVINAHGLPYLDGSLPTGERVDDLLGRMSLAQKVGQMAQAERLGLSSPQQIATLGLGSVLSGGGSTPAGNTPDAWAAMIDGFQRQALSTSLQIPLLYGADAVHGHSNVKDATIYPHNIGLGATRDPALVERIGSETASETKTTGVNWAFAPCLCVSRDERWGRTYESFGEDPALVTSFSAATITGLQGTDPSDITAADELLATAKHWAGDGGTTYDAAASGYKIDQGTTNVSSLDEFRRLFTDPYQPAIAAGVGSIMPSYSALSIDGGTPTRMTENPLNESLLKGSMGFDGFLISDWEAIDKLSGATYAAKVERSVNAGALDMAMAPYNFSAFIDAVVAGVNANRITTDRVDDAVRRILTEKFDLGLFENAFTDSSQRSQFGGAAHRATAAQAAAESQVLLKNDGVLPLARTGKLYVAGSNADDLGNQMGGWTISWQGGSGNGMTAGTTILAGIRAAAPDLDVTYSKTASAPTAGYGTGLVVVGETPYAEGQGDVGVNGRTLNLSAADRAAVDTVCAAMDCVVLVVSGRPQYVDPIADEANAIVAGFLPGSEGEGVAQVLLGDQPFTGRLPLSWPASTTPLPVNVGDAAYAPEWAYGWGLRTDVPRERLQTLRGELAGTARAAADALLDADVWAPDGSISDAVVAFPLIHALATELGGTDTSTLAKADSAVSLARDLAQAAVVAGEAPAEHAVWTSDAEHDLLSGQASSAVELFAKVVGAGVDPLAALTTTAPTISGTAQVGSPLTAHAGSWTVDGAPVTGVDVEYRWSVGGVVVDGATASTFTPRNADVGKTVTVTVIGRKAGHPTGSATSQPTAKVVAATVPTIAVVTRPSITGTPTVDAAVVADGGRWSPADVRLSYQWAVGGKPIKGATRSSYTPTAGDLGKSLAVTVTAARSGYAAASVVTAAKKVVAGAPPRSVKPPTISGKAKVGSRLTAKPGTWSPSSVRTSFQWLANGKSIKGATKSTYTPRTTDVGKKLSVRVTATRAGHRTAVATSKVTVAVPKVAPKVRAKLSRTTASTSSRVVVTVTVTATGVKAPTGVVTVRYGSKSVKAKVTSSKHGKVTVTLPRLRKGSYAVTATFAPSGSTGKVVSSAKAKAGTLRIR